MLKRAFDFTAALVGAILLSPLFLLVAVLIKLDSPGPVFYRGRRIGRQGRTFIMYKFRTMVVDAEARGPSVTYDRDPRITGIGQRLRNARIDEFPQLWNILRGEMSFVGPRPESPDYFERYTPEQKRIFEVTPGITGASQVQFLHEEDMLTNPETLDQDYFENALPPKIAVDMNYIRNQSFWLDIFIVFETLWVLLKDRFVKPPVPDIVGPTLKE